jgi:hypothetical protein
VQFGAITGLRELTGQQGIRGSLLACHRDATNVEQAPQLTLNAALRGAYWISYLAVTEPNRTYTHANGPTLGLTSLFSGTDQPNGNSYNPWPHIGVQVTVTMH